MDDSLEVEITGKTMAVVDAYWERFLAIEPLFATLVGDPRFDDALPDHSERGRTERRRVHAALVASAGGTDAGRGRLPGTRRHRRATRGLPAEAGRVPGLSRGAGGQCQRWARQRVVASQAVVARTIGQVKRLLATPIPDSPALAPLTTGTDEERSRAAEALREQVYPAYAKFLDVSRTYLPRAQETLGLLSLPGGEEIYRSEIVGWTTLPLEPDIVHRLGREHLERVQDERWL